MPHTIGFWHYQSGDELQLELFPWSGGAMANAPTGNPLIEADDVVTPGYYTATVTSEPGRYRARVRRSGVLIFDGVADLVSSDEVTILQGEAPPENVGIVQALSNSALSQLVGYRSVSVSIPTLCGSELAQPIIRGDSYLATHNRALEFSRADFPDLPPDCAVSLTARLTTDPAVQFQLSGSPVIATGTKVVRFEATTAETRTFLPGKYEFEVEVLFPDGNAATFVGPGVWLRVLSDLTDD